MRNVISTTYSPVTTSATGFASNVTGATWTLSTTATTDGLGHIVTIHNDSTTNHSAKTALLTGTDANGNAMTETMSLPDNAATTNSTKYFKTLTTIVPSATIGADTMDIGWLVGAVSPVWPIDRSSGNTATVFADISGTINYTGEETFGTVQNAASPPSDNNTWTALSGMTGKTADAISSCDLGANAFRIKLVSVTNGATLTVTIAQPRPTA